MREDAVIYLKLKGMKFPPADAPGIDPDNVVGWCEEGDPAWTPGLPPGWRPRRAKAAKADDGSSLMAT